MSRHDELNPTDADRKIVYVRQVRPDELPEGAPDTPLFSIHDATSARIGVAPARDLAFLAARQHDLTPVSVH
ncbi:MAG: DUF1150 family protein [Pseudomonadota bacterium]